MRTQQMRRMMVRGFGDRVRRPRGGSPGFSALEVLIALAITALAILAIASMFPSAYTNVAKSGIQTRAVNLAQQRMESLRNQPYANLPGMTENNLEFDTVNYDDWRRTTAITVDPDLDGAGPDPPVVGVTQVTVTVTPPSGISVTMTSLVAQ